MLLPPREPEVYIEAKERAAEIEAKYVALEAKIAEGGKTGISEEAGAKIGELTLQIGVLEAEVASMKETEDALRADITGMRESEAVSQQKLDNMVAKEKEMQEEKSQLMMTKLKEDYLVHLWREILDTLALTVEDTPGKDDMTTWRSPRCQNEQRFGLKVATLVGISLRSRTSTQPTRACGGGRCLRLTS